MEENEKQFPWDGNLRVKEEYDKLNYRIKDKKLGKKSSCALIFFSSHAIYFPNEENIFIETICKKDRYEWSNIAKHPKIKKKYDRIIFVRDIYKQWYVNGINKEVNSINKLVELLKNLTYDFEVTTCGISGGGYAAIVCGILMEAKRAFGISAQINLSSLCNRKNPMLLNERDNDKIRYFNIASILEQIHDSDTVIYYLYSYYCEEDREQSRYIGGKQVRKLAFDSESHGKPISKKGYVNLLTLEENVLNQMVADNEEKIINRGWFDKY